MTRCVLPATTSPACVALHLPPLQQHQVASLALVGSVAVQRVMGAMLRRTPTMTPKLDLRLQIYPARPVFIAALDLGGLFLEPPRPQRRVVRELAQSL